MECGDFGKGCWNSDQDVGIPIPTKKKEGKIDGVGAPSSWSELHHPGR